MYSLFLDIHLLDLNFLTPYSHICVWFWNLFCTISVFLCRNLIKYMILQDMGVDELSECVQDFYHNLSERLQTQFKGTA